MGKATDFYNTYFKELNNYVTSFDPEKLEKCLRELKLVETRGKKAMIFGNGGSSGIASHFAVDLTKTAGVRTTNFNEAGLITCYGNDYGYELWVEKAIEHYADEQDLVILISSSGQSLNMINAAKYLISKKNKVITLTGFEKNNPLRQLGDINLYVNSNKYNMVENTHQVWLLALIDYYIESKR